MSVFKNCIGALGKKCCLKTTYGVGERETYTQKGQNWKISAIKKCHVNKKKFMKSYKMEKKNKKKFMK